MQLRVLVYPHIRWHLLVGTLTAGVMCL